MAPDTYSNLLAFSAQVACIAVAGSVLPVLLRIDRAEVRYGYWRALLVLCLALPWLQGRENAAAQPTAAHAALASAPGAVSAPPARVVSSGAEIDWLLVMGIVVAAGAVVRGIWIAAGLFYLKRLRAAGQPAPPCDAHEELQRTIARADIRYVPGLAQPVTFGAWRPVVLLPQTLREHPPEIQSAVLCHELFHVKRRDWIWVLAEEGVRAALWFHPGVWWLVSRVQQTREEVIDQLSVLAMGGRRAYMEALMAFADEAPLAPATAFARRRHLFRRMVLISKEAGMSARRVVFSCAVMAVAMTAGSWYAVAAFPMTEWPGIQELGTEAGPLEKRAKPVTPENPVPRRVSSGGADYPAEAAAIGATGSVTLRLTLDEVGRIAEARQVSTSLRSTNPRFTMSFTGANRADVERFAERSAAGSARAITAAHDAMTRSAFDAVRQWRYDPPAAAPIWFEVTLAVVPSGVIDVIAAPGTAGGVPGRVGGGRGAGFRNYSLTVAAGAQGGVSSGESAAPVRVGGNIKAPTKIRDVRPVYPPDAQAARVQGVVIIEATIGTDGLVTKAVVLRSIPLLDQAAVDAVMQWQFTPTLLNGVPVPVIMTTTVNFSLQ